MLEREIKIEIKDPLSYIAKLEDLRAVFLGFAKQITYRFDTPKKDLKKKGIFLRTRKGFKMTVTLKKKIAEISDNENYKLREEIEVEINDFEKMNRLLEELGFTYLRRMEKYRARWQYNNLEITLDELPFGIFSEIEGPEKEIEEFLEKTQLQNLKRITKTYWSLDKEWKRTNNIKEENIVFKSQQSKLKKILLLKGLIKT